MTNTTIKKVKPKLEFFSNRIAFLTLLLGGGAFYWFSYRPYAKKIKNLERESFAREYLELQQRKLTSNQEK